MIEPDLAPGVECVELLDLMPAPATMTLAWRQRAAETAVRRAIALQASGRHLLVAGDPIAAAEVAAAPSATDLDAIAVCLLDLRPDAQAQRLAARGDPPELVPHHQAFAAWMRAQATDPLHMPHVVRDGGWAQMRWERLARLAPEWGMLTIDASDMSRREVADAARDWCRGALTGTAPSLRVPGP